MGAKQSASDPSSPSDLHLHQDDRKVKDMTHFLDLKARTHNALMSSKDGSWDQYEEDKENVRLVKGLFKTLDPAIVRLPGESFGQIQLSLKYDPKRSLLLVKVIQCRHLRSRDVRTKASDPYVKVQMYPDSHGHGAKTTQIVVETRSPVFNEIFAFRASAAELGASRVVAQVWDYDVAQRDDFLGEVMVDTATLDLQHDPVTSQWFDLKMETDLSITGSLSVNLTYSGAGTLFVTVHGAQGLSPRPHTHTAHPFVKVALPGVGSVHCTQTQRDTLDPQWQETFEFDLSEEELGWRYLVFHVVDEAVSVHSENHSLGQAIVDLQVMTSDPTFHADLPLADLRNTDHRLHNYFQQRVVTQELREACLAHTATKCPLLVFSTHSQPCKRVKVSCRKAGRRSHISGQIMIREGVPVY